MAQGITKHVTQHKYPHPAAHAVVRVLIICIVPVQVELPIVNIEVGSGHGARTFLTAFVRKHSAGHSHGMRIGLLFSSLHTAGASEK